MLNEELAACPFFQKLGLQPPGAIELVVAGESDADDLLFVVAPGHQIAPDDLQPAIALPDLLPEVAGAVTGGIGRVSLRAVVTLVEGQKSGRRTSKLGRH